MLFWILLVTALSLVSLAVIAVSLGMSLHEHLSNSHNPNRP